MRNSYTTMVLVAAALGLAFYKRNDIMDTVVPELPAFQKYDSLFQKYGVQYNVPWRWLKAIAMNESSLGQNPLVAAGLVSTDGLSYGLMQVTIKTASRLLGRQATPDDLNDPDTSVMLAAELMRELVDEFGEDDRESVIRAYNGGPNFMNTARGQSDTPIYYDRFVRNLNTILEKQPGDELERG